MSSLGTLVPERPCYVFHTYTQRYTAYSGTNRLTHPYKCILTPPAMCSQQLSVLHWIIHWYQKITFHNVFSFKKLLVQSVYLFIRCNKTKFFLRNTNNTDKNSVNQQNTHTKHLEKDNTGNEGSNYEPGCFWNLFLDSAREASNDFNIFLNFRFIKKQKPAGFFWENITC